MKKEVRQLRQRAVNSLVLSIEHFNRPWDRGRIESVVILLDHSFEMLLKAAIRHRGGKIRQPREKHTIGFGACVRKGLTDTGVQFLTDERALTLQAINGQRNAAYHYLVDLSEHQLYFYAQAGVTLFRDIHDEVFDKKLILELPERVLPISTTAPKDLTALFDREVKEVKELLTPGTRRKMDAIARARSLVVLENAINGEYGQPGDRDVERICSRLRNGEEWRVVFPGVASVNITSESDGSMLSLRLTKNEGVAVHLVKEEEGEGAPVAVRRVDELGYYSLGARDLARRVDLTPPKSRAVVDHCKLRDDLEYFKEFKIGKAKHGRYSRKAADRIREALATESVDEIWAAYQARRRAAQ